MAKGKHKKRAELRRHRETTERIGAMSERLKLEEQRRAAAERDAARADELLSSIQSLRDQLDAMTGDEVARLTTEISVVAAEVATLERTASRAMRRRGKNSTMAAIWNDLETLEAGLAHMTGHARTITDGIVVTRALKDDVEAIRLIQRARGLRRNP